VASERSTSSQVTHWCKTKKAKPVPIILSVPKETAVQLRRDDRGRHDFTARPDPIQHVDGVLPPGTRSSMNFEFSVSDERSGDMPVIDQRGVSPCGAVGNAEPPARRESMPTRKAGCSEHARNADQGSGRSEEDRHQHAGSIDGHQPSRVFAVVLFFGVICSIP
jgi:hypothetical protein